LQTLLMLSFTFELFIVISSLISITIKNAKTNIRTSGRKTQTIIKSSLMPIVTYAKCSIFYSYSECHHAGCRFSERYYAESRGTVRILKIT
jgi:hypothetical protein